MKKFRLGLSSFRLTAPVVLVVSMAPIRAEERRPSIPLDTASVRNLYLDGDFENAIGALEKHVKSESPMTRGDSLFAFKHLGVMHAATEASRERGKYYMLQLLNVNPAAKIADMFASDLIYSIFRNVQEEHAAMRGSAPAPVGPTAAEPPVGHAVAKSGEYGLGAKPPPPTDSVNRRSGRLLYFVLGGATILGAGIGTAYLLADEEPRRETVFPVRLK